MRLKKNKGSISGRSVLSPILVILVSGSLSLAILDKDNRPAYFDIVNVAVGYAFGSLKPQGGSGSSNNPDASDGANDSDDLNSPGNPD